MEIRGWSTTTEAGGNKNQDPRHLQKWDHQGVDKHNACLPTPCLKNPPTDVHFQIYTMGRKVGGHATST